MDTLEYNYPYKGESEYYEYFSKHIVKEWAYEPFKKHFFSLKLDPPSEKKLKATYIKCLNQIANNRSVPNDAKSYIKIFLEKVL